MEEPVPPRRGLTYQSQEAVGRMERVDATGAFLGCRSLAFVPSPPPGFPEKITELADLSRPLALCSDWSPRAGRCWSSSRGFR